VQALVIVPHSAEAGGKIVEAAKKVYGSAGTK
jgi:hypothetical protein